jgi:ParB family chromosome partitioning protein
MISVHDLTSSGYNFYSLSGIEDLKDSIEILGVQQNLIVQPIAEGVDQGKYEIIAGHRRRAAVKKLVEEGKTQFEMIPCRIETNPDEIRKKIAIIYTNSTTRELNEWEKIEQLNRLKALLQEYKKTHELPGRIRELLAETFKISTTQVGRMETIHANLVPELKEELKRETIGFSAAAELSRLSSADQRAVYEKQQEQGSVSLKEIKAQKPKAEPKPAAASEPPAQKPMNPKVEALMLFKELLQKELSKFAAADSEIIRAYCKLLTVKMEETEKELCIALPNGEGRA